MNIFYNARSSAGLRLLLGAASFVLCLVMISCSDDDDGNGDPVANTNFFASEDFYISFAAESRTSFNLSAISGSVNVSGKAGLDSIVIAGVRRVESESVADAQEHLSLLTVVTETNAASVSARTEQPQQAHGRNYIIDYHLRLPITWDVSVSLVNGELTIDSVNNSVTASVVNGSITLDHIVGNVLGQITNGSIICQMTLIPSGQCNLSAVNGSIGLEIPTNTSASLSAGVVNGGIGISGITLNNAVITPLQVTGVFGSGNGSIALSTVNGSILIIGY